jgi:hypothetical protein
MHTHTYVVSLHTHTYAHTSANSFAHQHTTQISEDLKNQPRRLSQMRDLNEQITSARTSGTETQKSGTETQKSGTEASLKGDKDVPSSHDSVTLDNVTGMRSEVTSRVCGTDHQGDVQNHDSESDVPATRSGVLASRAQKLAHRLRRIEDLSDIWKTSPKSSGEPKQGLSSSQNRVRDLIVVFLFLSEQGA